MDKSVKYADILTQVIREEAKGQFSLQPIKVVSACDRETGEFFLVAFGRDGNRRVDNIIFHARLVDGKVIIETDWIEDGLKMPMIEAGIDPRDIAFTWSLPNPNLEKDSVETMAAAA